LWTPADRPLAERLWGDPAVTRLISRQPLTPHRVRARLSAEIAYQFAYGFQYWPVFEADGGAFIGCCGLHPHREGVAELGVHLLPTHQGRGYATEAARAVLGFAFDIDETRAVFAGHHPDNAASRKLLTRLGFGYTHDELFEGTGAMHLSYLLERPPAPR